MCIVLNPRREHTQPRVIGLRIYHPTENSSLVYNKVVLLSKPVVLIPQDFKHGQYFEQQTRNLVYELRNCARIRDINREGLYPWTEHADDTLIYVQYSVISTVQAPILTVITTNKLVNTFEIGIPVLTHQYGDVKWI